ncbi:MAG: SMP-30/gluconolactonase/LRE family protein [Acidobacteria bacterium]|nr:SMP-30/gluconolactonase/LRE family protein [Acidobacteriota bacterium]MBI3662951.1 SMP-30/gluconolactonase/LRE family protein [Acidobacteriota bacterium]
MTRVSRTRLACLLALAGLVAAGAGAEHTHTWRQSNYDEFEKGTAKGVALRSDGKLVLAPRFAQFSDPNAAYLWALQVNSKGVLFAAGGSNAKVLRFDEKGTATTIFESQEMAAQALAMDARDNLYVGTSPDGKVYKIPAPDAKGETGKAAVFFEPKTKYIWDLVVDASGTVFVATGDKGEVYAVSPEGKGILFYRSPETHIRSLALDGKGNLLIGTEPNGLVARVSMASPAGADKPEQRPAFVLYETEKKEVTSLLVDRAGNIYAASVGEKTRTTAIFPQVQQFVPQTTITSTGQTFTTAVAMPPGQQATPFVPFPSLTGGSEVYRIAPDGAPESLWSSREDLVYALGLAPGGKLLLGTGNRGLVIQLEGKRTYATLPKTAASQVTGLVAGAGGKVFVATANPGKVFALGPEYEPEGSFESQAFDAKIFSQWGQLSWWGDNGATDGQVEFYVRTGNTSNPEKNWSPWAGPYANAKGQAMNCPPARFAQWKVVFKNPAAPRKTDRDAKTAAAAAGKSGKTEAMPPVYEMATSISWVSLAYLPKNVAPTVEAIIVQNPGVRVQGFPAPPQQQQPAQLRMPPATTGAPGMSVSQPQPPQPPRFDPPPQGITQRGYQSVVWSARDENDDDLLFNLYYRGEGETKWKLLKDRIEHKYFSWESNTLPDGAYYLKVVASDAPSNPPADALSGERESDRFEVDNTPPRVENLRAEPTSPEVRIQFEAKDSFSAIVRAEYSLDAGDWKLAFPVDRLSDSSSESYEIVLRELGPGEHTLAVRVFDQFENSASAKVTFTVEAVWKK